jgi:hypothetical protein
MNQTLKFALLAVVLTPTLTGCFAANLFRATSRAGSLATRASLNTSRFSRLALPRGGTTGLSAMSAADIARVKKYLGTAEHASDAADVVGLVSDDNNNSQKNTTAKNTTAKNTTVPRGAAQKLAVQVTSANAKLLKDTLKQAKR